MCNVNKDITGGMCEIPVRVGLFFDGTNNNMYRDRDGERVSEDKEHKALPKLSLTPEQCSHSNVARLFLAYPRDRQADGVYRFYIQGVGTPFPKIGEPTESQPGKAFAKGGLPRIVWGLLQVLNALHYTVYRALLYDDDEVGQLAQAYGNEVGRTTPGEQSRPMTHEDWFVPHLGKLKDALKAKPKPHIPSLTISVFGFSRGAAETVAFCHLFDRLLEGGKFAGIKTRIQFVGLFDVVASVGGSASIAKTTAMPGAVFDGHWDWANDVEKPLPGCVEKAVHLIAAHELRMNFPVTRIGGAREIYVPGVHSDVGGGYAPGDQGRSRGGQDRLLSQIPLALMYKEALRAGVPLVEFSGLEERVQVDFEISKELADAWETYTTALEGEGQIYKKHMELYYRWRAARLTDMESKTSFKEASAQDQQDLREANAMLAGDLEALRHRRDYKPVPFDPEESQRKVYGPEDSTKLNQWHLMRANSRLPLDDWEKFALDCFDHPLSEKEEKEKKVAAFFDDYVHDSFAGFYMAGEVTEYDKRAKVAEIMRKPPAKRDPFETKVAEITEKTDAVRDKRKAGEALSAEEEELLKTAEQGTPYPVMSDADAKDMRSPAIVTQTGTRREGGGYIILRGYYPDYGFFLRRSTSEEELKQAPTKRPLTPAGQQAEEAKAEAAAEKEPREFVWSDNLHTDIAKEREESVA